MSGTSSIEWTDKTWNPVRGCALVSPGCTNCYAMKFAHRFSGAGQAYEGLTMMSKGGPVWNGKVRLVDDDLVEPLRWRKPARIFVNSMSDLFHEEIPDAFILSVFDVMRECANGWTGRLGGERGKLVPYHTFQILTKRPARMLDFCTRLRFAQNDDRGLYLAADLPHNGFNPMKAMRNVWLGVSVEDQVRLEERVPLLLKTPAAVRWISAEPLLGPLSFEGLWVDHQNPALHENWLEALDWVVAGGESGGRARMMQPSWVRDLRDQCVAVGTPFFFKQWGNWAPPTPADDSAPPGACEGRMYNVGKKAAGRVLDGRTHDEYPA